MSSLIDTWLLLRNHESNGERNRLLFVIKSRGSAHSNQVREFVLTDDGAELLDVYVGPNGVLTGSARIEQVAQERARRRRQVDEANAVDGSSTTGGGDEAQIAALQAQLSAETAEFERFVAAETRAARPEAAVRAVPGRQRSGDQAELRGGAR